MKKSLIGESSDTKKKDKERHVETRVLVREYPDTIYFYPTAIVGLLFFFLQYFNIVSEGPWRSILGVIFIMVLASNLFIVGFDFNLQRVALLSGVVIIITLLYINLKLLGIIPAIPIVNLALPEFGMANLAYLVISLVIFIHLGIAFLASYFSYWVFTPTEIYHKAGIFEDTKRFGAQGAKVFKVTNDLFELILFGAADIYVLPEREERMYQLKNVFRASDKERRIRKVLSYVPSTQVEV